MKLVIVGHNVEFPKVFNMLTYILTSWEEQKSVKIIDVVYCARSAPHEYVSMRRVAFRQTFGRQKYFVPHDHFGTTLGCEQGGFSAYK